METPKESSKWSSEPYATQASPDPYDRKQVDRWLVHVRSDFWWRHQMPIGNKQLSFACGYTTNRFAPTGFRESVYSRLSKLIDPIEDRRLCFCPVGNKTKGFVWLDPAPKKLARMPEMRFWSLGARCTSCNRNQYLPLYIAGDERVYVACYHCIPPDQYPSLGARIISKSLIHEVLKYYS